MGKMGNGYGSEFHLLRLMGRHRKCFDAQVTAALGASEVDWPDVPRERGKPWSDGEWKGLNFLADNIPLQQAWRQTWPSSGNPPNWDAIGRIRRGDHWEWLLVEANEEELASSCKASSKGGRPLIEVTLQRTKQALGVSAGQDWLNGYYQYCNRLAVLQFLTEHKVPARLLFIYFLGDKKRIRASCPRTESDWAKALKRQKDHVGLPDRHPLHERIHNLFLPADATQHPESQADRPARAA